MYLLLNLIVIMPDLYLLRVYYNSLIYNKRRIKNRMNILFVVDRLYNNQDPNINLIKNTLPFFNENIKSFFLGHDLEKSEEFCFNYSLDEKVRNLYFSLNKKNNVNKVLELIKHPILSFFGFLKIFNIDIITINYKRNIEKICKHYNIDCIIAVSAPFYTSKAVSKAKVKAKKIVIMFDPYAKHYLFGNKRTEKMEKQMFDKVDKIFVPKLLLKDYKNDDKVIGFDFPAIDYKFYNNNKTSNKEITLTYVGSLYSDIRHPKHLFNILSKINNVNFKLNIVGGVYGDIEDEFYRQYDNFIQEKVSFIGAVSHEEAIKYLKDADILVNIGNLIENQLPSKILEYISTGKPILHISQIDNCPCLSYLKRYENYINFYTNKEVTSQELEKLVQFLLNRRNFNFIQIEEKFKTATAKYFAKELEKSIGG